MTVSNYDYNVSFHRNPDYVIIDYSLTKDFKLDPISKERMKELTIYCKNTEDIVQSVLNKLELKNLIGDV